MEEAKELEISVVIPAFNEEESIEQCLSIVTASLEVFCSNFEIIVVDDGSLDNTLKKVREYQARDARVKIVKLLSNYGHMAAIEQGLLRASGKYIVTIDADLQDNPNDIRQMYELIINGQSEHSTKIDVVQTFRSDRTSDSFFKRKSARLYYRMIRSLSGIPIVQDSADFRMITSKVNSTINKLNERNKIYRLLIPALGFRIVYIPTIRHSRYAGESKYTFSKMFGLAMNSLTEFSDRPLKLMIKVGFLASTSMFFLGGLSLVLWLIGSTVPGWTSVIFLLLASNGLIMMSLGFLGVYIGNIYSHLKNRPTAIVESSSI
jgi:glycosyltransferase involved in cell wall biosynthesis